MHTDKEKYIHTPGGSPRNPDGYKDNNYSCPDPLPEFTKTNLADVNNGVTSDKPANEGGNDGMIFHPTGHKGNPGSHKSGHGSY